MYTWLQVGESRVCVCFIHVCESFLKVQVHVNVAATSVCVCLGVDQM